MNIVIKVNDETKNRMIDYYKDKIRDKIPPYAIFQAEEEDTIITLYQSGKCMFQGTTADVDANMWQAVIENDKPTEVKDELYRSNSIGSDEVGTGDYFGPIVVTAAYVKKDDISFLESIHVKDSKKLTDDDILKIVPKFINKIKYKSIILGNSEYNEKYSKEVNMNKIKAIMHNKALTSLKNEIKDHLDYVIIDEFAKEDRYYNYLSDTPNPLKGITFTTKAEEKNLAVAAASLISRYIFLKEMGKLSDYIKIPIPKGSGSNVDKIGEEIVDKYGKDKLKEVAKLNFSNTKKILKTLIF
ncbi:MAG TPA: ribonuclease HIII [Bacilli bacterium]|nr:ribonuclease HIII [Bacilli bacterium]